MKLKALIVSAVMLSCFVAFLDAMILPALGQGCGTNPLGDTSGDTDFYVSKNQNLGSTGSTLSEASGTGKAAVALGAVTTKAEQKAMVESLNPDKPGPQSPGTAIIWTASATNPGNEELLFDFLLNGPSTEGIDMDQTGWIAKNSWIWNTTDKDAGETIVEVRIKTASASDFLDRKTQRYVIESNKNTRKLAPDEIQVTPITTGPNMNMPETKPKPAVQESTATTQVQSVQTQPEPEEPKVMQVDGKWNVKLQNIGSSMDLILIQTGERIMGSGYLNEGNAKIPLMATGAASANSMSLDVKTVISEYGNKIDKRFNLDLAKIDRIISGSYEAYSGEEMIGTGNATTSRFGK